MTYDYACDECDHGLQVEQSIKDDPIRRCPNCRTDSLRRLISGGQGFVLRGGGWFRDGYATPRRSTDD